jgi:hypothetical protein
MAVQVEKIGSKGHPERILAHLLYGILCHMAIRYREVVQVADGVTVEAIVAPDRSYRLALLRHGTLRVEFWNDGAAHRRQVGERTSAYEFRSIEQLRYDFERDAEDALGRD